MPKTQGMNYKQIYAIKRANEEKIQSVCPDITNNSGIYVFYRTDETDIKFCYCGQAKHLKERCASHLSEYDHIALSLKKRGFYSKDNPFGWKLTFKECDVKDLDENEIITIKYFANNGYQLFNVTAGGQGKGKTKIGEYKPHKTYRDGLQQGKLTLARDLKHIIDKHLTVELKAEKKANKTSQKAFEKFMELLNEENYERSVE